MVPDQYGRSLYLNKQFDPMAKVSQKKKAKKAKIYERRNSISPPKMSVDEFTNLSTI